MSMTSHPVAFGTIGHTERAGELLGLLWQEVLRLQCDLKDAQAELERLRADNAALRREAHTWWTAARDAEKRAQRVPLDQLDIEEMWDEVTGMDVDDWHQEFARRIERWHGIGA